MKKYVLISLLVCSNFASANWDSPTKPFSTKENNHETMLITWKTVDNIQQVCQAEYKKRGFGAFNYKVDACSFWNDTTKTCTIYTKKNPTMHDVGHEIRHCYQGNWH
jgi:hypothetical protein